MKSGDIVFVRGKTPIISKLIKKFDGEFSHIAIAVSSTHILESDFFVNTRIAPMNYDDIKIVDLNLTSEERDMVVHLGIQLIGTLYDYEKIFGYLLEKIFHFNKTDYLDNKRRFICSELVDFVLFALGKIPDDEYLGDKTPNELYRYIINIFPQLTGDK